MDIKEQKTVDMLVRDSVSILTQKFIEIDGVPTQVGNNHRCGYVNSEAGRLKLMQNEPKDVVNAVMAIWGDKPTIVKDFIGEENLESESVIVEE